jgi:AMP deaminase
MTENDIGAAAMEPTKAAFSELASHAGLGGMGGLTAVSGQAHQVGPGVGALDEKMHRKRTESMGRGMNGITPGEGPNGP